MLIVSIVRVPRTIKPNRFRGSPHFTSLIIKFGIFFSLTLLVCDMYGKLKRVTSESEDHTMAELLFFDDLSLDDSWVSRTRQVTEADVAQFADLTGDFNPLHVDEEFAKQTPFRKPIVHGLLGLSLVAGIGSDSPQVETVAFLGIQEWSFRKPIFFDDTLHVVTTVLQLAPNGRRRGRVTWGHQLLNQDNLIVQEGTLQSLVACRVASLHIVDIAERNLAATGK